MMTTSTSRPTHSRKKPSASDAVQVDLPRALEVGERIVGECARWFPRGWGFGFIKVHGADDVFVSARDLQNADRLYRGDRVAFDVALDGQGRYQAKYAVLLDGEPVSRWQQHGNPNGVAIDSPSCPAALWEDA